MTFRIYHSMVLFTLKLVCPLTNSKCPPVFVSNAILHSSLNSLVYASLSLVLTSYLLSDFPCKFPRLHSHSPLPKHSQSAHIHPLLIPTLSIPLRSKCPTSCTADGSVLHSNHIAVTKHSPAKHNAHSYTQSNSL